MARSIIPDGMTQAEWNRIQRRTQNNTTTSGGTQVAPPNTDSGRVGDTPNVGGGGPSAGDIAAANAAAEAAKAKKAGKDQTKKQNTETQKVIDQILNSLKGYETGRDTQLKNADTALQELLQGILSSYTQAVSDYKETGTANEQDQAAKSAANVTNRARERVSLLQQAASQGAGETDQLRSQIQAFLNSDANQQEVDRAFFDTQRQINSQIAGAGAQAESQRRTGWQQNQEAVANAWNEYWKNYSDAWTNAQRTGASNTNIKSDYSTEFKANYGGKDPVKEAAKYAGKAYTTKDQKDEWYNQGRQGGLNRRTTSTNRAGATTIKAPKAAEGATLRGRW